MVGAEVAPDFFDDDGDDTDGAIYAISSAGFKTWLPDNATVEAKAALIALNGGNPAAQPQPDRSMFKAFGPVLGPRPERTDEWGLPL